MICIYRINVYTCITRRGIKVKMSSRILSDFCVICEEPATYGYDGSSLGVVCNTIISKVRYCERHVVKGTINLAMPKCRCNNEARYIDGLNGYCKSCKPRSAKRVSYITCRLCNNKAVRGTNKYIPIYCEEHAPSFTVQVKYVSCRNCELRATYGRLSLGKPVSCYNCKQSGEVFISARKLCYCLKRSTYGHYKTGRPLFCVTHAINGMCNYRIGLDEES